MFEHGRAFANNLSLLIALTRHYTLFVASLFIILCYNLITLS